MRYHYNPTLKELLSKYIQHCLVIRNYSRYTIKGYEDTFRLFFGETTAIYPRDLNRRMLEDWYFNGRINRKWSAGTFRDHFKHMNPFFKWLIKEGHLETNYLDGMEKPRMEQKLPKTLSKDNAELILEAAYHMRYTYKFERYRNRAIIGVMVLAGLRRQEVMKLKLNDVDLENRTLYVRQGKWSKDRMIPINNRLAVILDEYLRVRREYNKNSLTFFVSAQRDNPVAEKCLKNLVDRIKKITKIDFSCHTLRHAFATLMLEGGCDIYTLSKIMGHSKITTTTIYLSCSSHQMSKSIEMHAMN